MIPNIRHVFIKLLKGSTLRIVLLSAAVLQARERREHVHEEEGVTRTQAPSKPRTVSENHSPAIVCRELRPSVSLEEASLGSTFCWCRRGDEA